MKFWFCEKCGKRITEADFPPGLDPEKANGQVVCKACAVPLPLPQAATTSKTKIARISGSSHSPAHAPHAGHPAAAGTPKQGTPPPPTNTRKVNLVLGTVALFIVGFVVFLMMNLNTGTRKDEKTASAAATNTGTTPGNSTTTGNSPPTAAPRTQTQTAVDAQPAPLNRTDMEAAASDAFFAMNKKLPALKSSEQAAALEEFIDKYPDSTLAARANRMLKELREAAADAIPVGKPDVTPPQTPEKHTEAVDPKPTPTVSKPALPAPTPPATPATPQPTPPPPPKIEPVKIDESLVAYTTFQADFFAALAARQLDRATTLLAAAQKEPLLTSRQPLIAPLAPAIDWIKELDAAPSKGAAMLKDIETFTLPVARGEPLRIGRSAPFKLESFKDGVLTFSNQGLSLPVPLASLPEDSRTKLANLALGETARARVMRAASELLSANEKQLDTAAASIRTVLQREQKVTKASATAAELACLQQLLSVAETLLRERAAEAALKEIQSVEINRVSGPHLATFIENFKTTYGTTLVGQKAAADLQTREASIRELSGLLAYWKFDEKEGTTAADSVSQKQDATLVNGPQWVEGKFGNAISLNGTDQFVRLPDKLFAGHTTCSLSLWFKTTSGGGILGYENVAAPAVAGNFVPVLFVDTEGHLRGQHWVGHGELIRSANVCNDGKWHHAALCAKDDTQTLYLDGTACGTLNGKIDYLSMWYAQLGVVYSRSWPGTSAEWYYFKGELDDVRLYAQLLSADEVRQLSTAPQK